MTSSNELYCHNKGKQVCFIIENRRIVNNFSVPGATKQQYFTIISFLWEKRVGNRSSEQHSKGTCHMKIAVSGKGGVGKTTFSALLARTLSADGKRVLAIDADPDANLAAALGIAGADKIVPISEMKEMIFERTGAQPGTLGGFFKLNPKVDDLPDALSARMENIKLMRLGSVKKGAADVYAPKARS